MGEQDGIPEAGGPFVTVATFCERILEEKDGVNTLVRVVDRYSFEPPPAGTQLPPGVKVGVQTFLCVILKSGDFVGPATVTIRIRRPSGSYLDKPISAPVTFKGGEQGVALHVGFSLSTEEAGLYWAEVVVNEKLATRVPLRIEQRSTPDPASSTRRGQAG